MRYRGLNHKLFFMQNASKKAVLVGSLAFAVAVAGAVPFANAQGNNSGSGKLTTEERQAKKAAKLAERQAKKQARLEARMNRVYKRTIPGKVVSFDGTTLVMTKGNKTYTVTTSATTQFVDRKWQAIDKSLIVAGHKVTVKGTYTKADRSKLTGLSVRDVALPAKTTTETAD